MTKNKDISTQDHTDKPAGLEAGTYEILSKRLQNQKQELQEKLNALNASRKEVFGSIDTALLTTERVNTEHNCVPWDMEPIGDKFLFGYNVHMGLKVETQLSDVFSIYSFKDNQFHAESLELINNKEFIADFKKLYKYYKNTHFVKFAHINSYLYMVFKVGKSNDEVKTFKWLIKANTLAYIDNRSDHEYVFPSQHEFEWKKTNRNYHRSGKFPHLSIDDRVFVETIGGELTIKIEDNTDSGKGIYHEKVENADQRLEDAEIYYAIVGNIIILKIKPYQEKDFRYILFNDKLKEARRVDAIKDACALLPDDYGIIFSNGYYLQTGEFKQFENQLTDMMFEKRVASPNGEDFMYVFYNRTTGIYLLLPYNLIEQKVENPLICHGYSIFENGHMINFKADQEAKKHHVVQIWQTPYLGPNYQLDTTSDSYLFKVGNKEIVRAMAECHEIITLIERGDVYENLYVELNRLATDIQDSYHWIDNAESQGIHEPLQAIRKTSNAAVAEFEKVAELRKNTKLQVDAVVEKVASLLKKIKRRTASTIDEYVNDLSALRSVRGELISLKTLRYVDLEAIENLEAEVEDNTQKTAQNCVKFLLKKEALNPYQEKVNSIETKIDALKKIVEANALSEEINAVSSELEMLIEIVTNLQIEDPTETTRIIDNISTIYAQFNKIKANLKSKRLSLLSIEGKAEFNAQIKLVDQGVINYIDLCDTPDKCDEYLTKLMVQLEELEGKFSEFDEFIEKISQKREEIYNAFESRKINLIEARNKRANTLMQAADRILNAVKSRMSRFDDINDINGYFAGDLMIEKARDIIADLTELGDTVKADDIQGRLKAVREEAVRQLKDKKELFVGGDNVIQFGNHQFSVNTQSLDLTVVPKGDDLYFHLTGTNFFEKIEDEKIELNKAIWDQSQVSENQEVYKAEYLAYQIINDSAIVNNPNDASLPLEKLHQLNAEELLSYVQQFMSTRYNEAYVKGVHDQDALKILLVLLKFLQSSGLLRFSSDARACAQYYWKVFAEKTLVEKLHHQLLGVNAILKVFPHSSEFESIHEKILTEMTSFVEQTQLFPLSVVNQASKYLFLEVVEGGNFVIDQASAKLYEGFFSHLKKKKVAKTFDQSLEKVKNESINTFALIKYWLKAYIQQEEKEEFIDYINETAVIILTDSFKPEHIIHVSLHETIDDLTGTHPVIVDKSYDLNYNHFTLKLDAFENQTVPMHNAFQAAKKELTAAFSDELRLEEFKPKVLSAFVRNKLIDNVYLPLIGANLAKQIGTVGENKRTDLMGMLLLISPPGYGKTTLMEYIASRLGLIFMKINGPAIGHQVTSIDPGEATNAGAREELEKLNLAFEMGDNVMIYLDDIQHCNPELLQKFISLCDGQRKIEGIYKGKSKTYDFRGKKICVVMAGNPYTESGEKFQIPDMLANRADIYNLGDIIGDNAGVFKLSYLENCLTSNPVLNKLAGKSQKDLHTLIKIAETGNREGMDFESSFATAEIDEYVNVLKKLFKVRDTILKINLAYIESAAQSDEYRTAPPFKLQGSYRDMNKIAERVVAVMNDKELATLIDSHYENEAQTLTSGAEANLLKYKMLEKKQTDQEQIRWNEIVEIFMRKQKLGGLGSQNQVGQVLLQMEDLNVGVKGIIEALTKG